MAKGKNRRRLRRIRDRFIVPGDRPGWLDRYLVQGEIVVVSSRLHKAVMIRPSLQLFGLLVLAVVADAQLPSRAQALSTWLWFVFFFYLLWYVWLWLEWSHDWFVGTSKRLLKRNSLISNTVSMMPLGKVTDMRYERSPMGQLLGYGRFVMENAGQEQALRNIEFVPRPDETYRAIVTELFGGRVDAKDGDDEQTDAGGSGSGTGGSDDGSGDRGGSGSDGGSGGRGGSGGSGGSGRGGSGRGGSGGDGRASERRGDDRRGDDGDGGGDDQAGGPEGRRRLSRLVRRGEGAGTGGGTGPVRTERGPGGSSPVSQRGGGHRITTAREKRSDPFPDIEPTHPRRGSAQDRINSYSRAIPIRDGGESVYQSPDRRPATPRTGPIAIYGNGDQTAAQDKPGQNKAAQNNAAQNMDGTRGDDRPDTRGDSRDGTQDFEE